MAFKGNGSTGYVSQASGIDTSNLVRYTWHFWYRNASAPGSGANSNPLSIVQGATNYNTSFAWDHTNSGFRQSAHHINADHVNFTIAKFTTTLLANTWYGLGATWDTSTLKAYLNGVLDTTVPGSAPDAAVTGVLTLLAYDAASAFDAGEIAEFGLWRADLDAGEMAALGKGYAPSLIRPASLILYIPCVRDLVVKKPFGGAFSITGGVSVTPHPRQIYGWQGTDLIHADTASHPDQLETIAQGLSLVASTPEPPAIVEQTATFTGAFAYDAFGYIAHGVRFQSRPKSTSGDLAGGRIKEKSDLRR